MTSVFLLPEAATQGLCQEAQGANFVVNELTEADLMNSVFTDEATFSYDEEGSILMEKFTDAA